jgi:hypothetical protein
MNSVRVLPRIAAASSISCRVLFSMRRLTPGEGAQDILTESLAEMLNPHLAAAQRRSS